MNQLILDNRNFCNDWDDGDREIYYTSSQEIKGQLDGVMERVRKYLDFICKDIYDLTAPKVPGISNLVNKLCDDINKFHFQ